jgi:hypothetical protein
MSLGSQGVTITSERELAHVSMKRIVISADTIYLSLTARIIKCGAFHVLINLDQESPNYHNTITPRNILIL